MLMGLKGKQTRILFALTQFQQIVNKGQRVTDAYPNRLTNLKKFKIKGKLLKLEQGWVTRRELALLMGDEHFENKLAIELKELKRIKLVQEEYQEYYDNHSRLCSFPMNRITTSPKWFDDIMNLIIFQKIKSKNKESPIMHSYWKLFIKENGLDCWKKLMKSYDRQVWLNKFQKMDDIESLNKKTMEEQSKD